MFDNLRDGPVPCVRRVGPMAFWQQFSNKVDRARGERQIASTGSPSNIALAVALTSFSGTVRTTPVGPCEGRTTSEQDIDEIGGSRCLVACTAASALAGSVTQPGETVGLATGAPLPPGWYAINTVDWGSRVQIS